MSEKLINQILIGSYAIVQYFEDFRKCSDIDIATVDVKYSTNLDNQRIEFKPIPAFASTIEVCVSDTKS